MRVLRKGTEGEDVRSWQFFLVGTGLALEVDGRFGNATVAATTAFQVMNSLEDDGVAGLKTQGKAMIQGYQPPGLEFDNPADPRLSLFWPPKPKFFYPSHADLVRRYGMPLTDPQPDGTLKRIGATGPYELVNLTIPTELRLGFILPASTIIHKRVAAPFLALLQAWKDEQLSHLIRTWGGLYNLRYKRGLPGQLSDHGLGIAFDINPAWNGLGKVPAVFGKEGSVRALVPTANELGWYWLGHASNPDGMHFVYAKEPA